METFKKPGGWLTIPFSIIKKTRIKFIARRVGISSAASFIRFLVLKEVNAAMIQYQSEKNKQKLENIPGIPDVSSASCAVDII
jgi:hypothetical protein